MRGAAFLPVVGAFLFPAAAIAQQSSSGVRVEIQEPTARGNRPVPKIDLAALGRIHEAEHAYARCVLDAIRDGTKLDFGDAALDGAIRHCAHPRNVADALEEAMLPIQDRQQAHEHEPLWSLRQKAATAAEVMFFLEESAGGRPAVSTARSK